MRCHGINERRRWLFIYFSDDYISGVFSMIFVTLAPKQRGCIETAAGEARKHRRGIVKYLLLSEPDERRWAGGGNDFVEKIVMQQ